MRLPHIVHQTNREDSRAGRVRVPLLSWWKHSLHTPRGESPHGSILLCPWASRLLLEGVCCESTGGREGKVNGITDWRRGDLIHCIGIRSVNQEQLHDPKVMEFRGKEQWSHFILSAKVREATVWLVLERETTFVRAFTSARCCVHSHSHNYRRRENGSHTSVTSNSTVDKWPERHA